MEGRTPVLVYIGKQMTFSSADKLIRDIFGTNTYVQDNAHFKHGTYAYITILFKAYVVPLFVISLIF